MTPDRGNELARIAGLDLVVISPNAQPPVCKIMDLGKFKYEQQKREAEARNRRRREKKRKATARKDEQQDPE